MVLASFLGAVRSRRLRWPSGDRLGKKPQSEKPLRSGGVVKNLCSFSTKVNVRRVVKVFDRSSLAANFLLLVLGRVAAPLPCPGILLPRC